MLVMSPMLRVLAGGFRYRTYVSDEKPEARRPPGRPLDRDSSTPNGHGTDPGRPLEPVRPWDRDGAEAAAVPDATPAPDGGLTPVRPWLLRGRARTNAPQQPVELPKGGAGGPLEPVRPWLYQSTATATPHAPPVASNPSIVLGARGADAPPRRESEDAAARLTELQRQWERERQAAARRIAELEQAAAAEASRRAEVETDGPRPSARPRPLGWPICRRRRPRRQRVESRPSGRR